MLSKIDYLYDLEEYNKNRGLNIDLFNELKTFTSKNFNDIMGKIQNQDYNIEEIKKYREKYIEIDANNVVNDLSKFILNLI